MNLPVEEFRSAASLGLRNGLLSFKPRREWKRETFYLPDDFTATPERIINTVAQAYSLRVPELLGRCREVRIVWPRQVAMFFLIESGISSTEAGRILGRDHSAVLHGAKKVRHACRTNQQVKASIERIRQQLTLSPAVQYVPACAE